MYQAQNQITTNSSTGIQVGYYQPQPSLSGPMDEDQSPSKIRDAFSVTEGAATNLHLAISELEKRIDTILSPAPPIAGNTITTGTTAPGIPSSHLHGRIADTNRGFQHAIDRLRDLRMRVEV